MGIEKYINAFLDRKEKPAGTGSAADLVTVMALARHADDSRSAAGNPGRGAGCLSDHEMAAYLELKKKYAGYDRAVRHMADCARCRTRAFELSGLMIPEKTARKAAPPADVIDRAFADARAMTGTRQRPSARRALIPLAAAAAVAVALSGFLYQAFRPHPGAAYITFFAGSVTLVRDGKPAAPAVRLALGEADTIRTGANSFATLQIDESIVVRIAENSTVTIKSILDRKRRELFMDRGAVLSRVGKLPRGSSYRIATPTIVAAVKGTEFTVRYRPGTAVLAVRRGAVGVSSGKEGTETLVPAGTTALFSGRETRRTISGPESSQLEALSRIPVVQGIENRAGAELSDLLAPYLATTAKPGTAAIERMKTKYGYLHTVSLYNGRVIEGIILKRGKNYIILTPKGKISIPERQIRATRARYVRKT